MGEWEGGCVGVLVCGYVGVWMCGCGCVRVRAGVCERARQKDYKAIHISKSNFQKLALL